MTAPLRGGLCFDLHDCRAHKLPMLPCHASTARRDPLGLNKLQCRCEVCKFCRRLKRRWTPHVGHFLLAPLCGAVHFHRGAIAAVVGCVKLGCDENAILRRVPLTVIDPFQGHSPMRARQQQLHRNIRVVAAATLRPQDIQNVVMLQAELLSLLFAQARRITTFPRSVRRPPAAPASPAAVEPRSVQ